jgi:hypothetical protein
VRGQGLSGEFAGGGFRNGKGKLGCVGIGLDGVLNELGEVRVGGQLGRATQHAESNFGRGAVRSYVKCSERRALFSGLMRSAVLEESRGRKLTVNS